MTAPNPPSTTTNTTLSSLESSLNKIFLAVGDFLEFNSRTTSLGLDNFSHRPQDEARRALETNLQSFHSSCDALEIQIIRAKQVSRREIELAKHPSAAAEPEKVEEVVEPEVVAQDEKMEEVNGINNDVEEEQVKPEEEGEKEEEMSEEGLFTSEIENWIDPNGFSSDMGFGGEDLGWMDNV